MSGSPPDEFPPSSRLTPPTTLAGSPEPPVDLTPLSSFVGRQHELALVIAFLQHPDVHLVTLTGPGGIGKTRLGVRVAAEVRNAFADGVDIVSLATVRDPELLLPTVAQALDVPDATDQPLLKRLRAVLHDRQLLLVLDNLEQIADAAALLVADLLATCPRLRVLATSRTRLGVSGEQVVPLGALSAEAAQQLFVARARSQVPQFHPTGETTLVVSAICEKLDRLPLAIELAAARVAVLPPCALLARLEHCLPLLTGGPRDAPARQRTMRDTIAWSYDLLDVDAQRLFCRLGVFVGGFTLDAAQAVAGSGEDVLGGISTLVTASLVNPSVIVGDEPRFSMLETIREYALEQLMASGEEPVLRRAHVRHVLLLAERLWLAPTGNEHELQLARLRPEQGNVRVALGWALEHEPVAAAWLAGSLDAYWNFTSSFAEGRAWVERALAATTPIPSHIRARALATAGWMAMEQGDLAQAEVYLSEAANLARALGDDRLLSITLNHIGKLELSQGHLEAAWQIHEESLTRATVSGVELDIATATLNLGMVARNVGDLPQAQSFLEKALAMHQASGSALGIAIAESCLGSLVLSRGDNAAAEALLLNAFRYFAGLSDWANVARILEGLAEVTVNGAADRSTRLLGAAAAMRERVGRPRNRAEQPRYEQVVKTARTALGRATFAATWDAGTQLTWEEVLTEVTTFTEPLTEAGGESHSLPALATSHGLTRRELEVLRLLTEGRSNRAMAAALSLSERTIEHHVLHVMNKLGVASRTAAATYAIRKGLD